MEKKLSAWCKNAKIEMINRDLKTTTLAKELDMNRSYVSSILNGRVYSAPAVKKISDYLGIADSDTTTVLYSSTVCDKYTEDRKKEAIESLSDEVKSILFNEEEECQKVCDKLNEGLGNFLYKNNGESIKEYLKMAKRE